MAEWRGLTIVLIPEGGQASHSFTLGRRAVRWLAGLGCGLFVLMLLVVGSWWNLTSKARDAVRLEEEVAELRMRDQRVEGIAADLAATEAAYERLRDLFGSAVPGGDAGLWLPPATGPRPTVTAADPGAAGLPTSWPLTASGFITRTLLADAEVEHPGIDIAVPTGSYIRAAGSGEVVEAGADPIYGNFLVVEHADGYRSLYGHASLLLVEEGDPVRRNEAIALTGSSGRSTAPHLHFEILRDGAPVDPLSLVTQP